MPEKRIGPHALAFGCYLAAMSASLLLVGAIPFLALYAALLLTLAWLVGNRLNDPASVSHLRRECLFYAVAMNLTFQAMAGAIPAVRTRRYDDDLLNIDLAVFGGSPNVWAEQFAAPWLIELLSLCYLFFMPLLFANLVRYFFWEKALLGPFYRGLFTVYGIGFLGYLIVPAAGPYLSHPELFTLPLEGGLIARVTHTMVILGSNKVDVFPSLHCAVSAYILCFSYRHHRREFRWLLLPVVGLWISTIYLRYHYFVDVLFGFALAAFALALTRAAPYSSSERNTS